MNACSGHPGYSLLLSVLMGCAVSPPTTQETGDPTGLDSGTNSSTWNPEPEWTAQEALDTVEASLELGFPHPISLLEAYQLLMTTGDENCPGDDNQLIGGQIPWEGCTSDSGTFFSGVASFVETQGTGTIGPNWSFHLGAGFLIIDSQGLEYEAGGNLFYSIEQSEKNNDHHWAAQIEGSWVHEGGAPWLLEGISASLSLEGLRKEEELTYGLSGNLGVAETWYSLDSLNWNPSCGDQPQGRIGIRDPSGLWFWMTLDADCSGCGTGSWDGSAATEELCVDLSQIQARLLELGEVEP